MSDPRFETPSGAIDGVNTTFTTLVPYIAGTLAVYRNGQLQDTDCWTETDPASGVFDIVGAPPLGATAIIPAEKIKVFYLDTLSTKVVEGIVGVLEDAVVRVGRIEPVQLRGTLTSIRLVAQLVASEQLVGLVEPVDLVGRLEC